MCGIAGIFRLGKSFPVASLHTMGAALAHRGPDAEGVVAWDASGERLAAGEAEGGLVHRRLSILDLSERGSQPMTLGSEQPWIVYNGECYNFRELREELEGLGRHFESDCDTEVLLHGMECWGLEALLGRMNGMFALALWCPREKTLQLVRDRMGQKPLYYAELADGGIAFASEIKALLASGVVDSAALDLTALDQFWALGYMTGGRTAYAGIRQLAPGELGTWRAGQGMQRKTWWEVPAWGAEENADRSLDELADELEALLADAVRMRLVADVPVGLFLSGGIDSSLICALAAKEGADLAAYTIQFAEAAYDETEYAIGVAKHLGLAHKVMRVDDQLEAQFDAIAGGFDEPFGDLSCIPTWFLCREARREVTVALSGDAGDELFGGYDDYRVGMQLWGGVPGGRASGLKGRLAQARLRRMPAAEGFTEWAQRLSGRHRKRLWDPASWTQISAQDTLQDRRAAAKRTRGGSPLSTMQAADLHTYLPDDILVKVDRMSMAVSLECRSPFLDHRVVEFAAGLPEHALMDREGTGKIILRHILKRHVPSSFWDRPKQGFTPPWESWCQGMLRDRVIRDWQATAAPLVQPEATDWLLPEGAVSHVLPWNAYAWSVWRRQA